MKEFLGSSGMTNILFAAFLAMVGWAFIDHVRQPWHGTVGVELARMQKDIEAIRDAHRDDGE